MVNVTQTDVSVERDVTTRAAPQLHLQRGASVGRYVILDVVGEGGMGIVYAAYDPELDRKLALKLLRTAATERRAERRRLRLIREAQAMARLSHANVITVHDVGTIDDQVFVAMEFIEGCSLAEWIRMDHDWRRVVDVFVQAGEGLAAAHAAGLVHRDFKPDNVMLTGEHRAVVTDFGLARAAGRRDASESRDPEGVVSPSRASLSTTVTAAGAIMGTPAYMSPEQHEGRNVDARSDQFAFAVALYEALFGVRPFPGDDVASLAYNVGAGNVRPAPARSPIPTWIRQVLLRALSVEPSERYPSMVELLEALRRDRSTRHRWPWLAVGAATVLGATFAGGAWLRGAPTDAEVVAGALADPGGISEDPCGSAERRLEAVLGAEGRAPAREAFEGAALPFAPEVWPAVDAALDRWRERWRATHTAVCRVSEADDASVGAGPVLCLQRRLADVDALLDVFAAGNPQALERALDAVLELPAPQRCRTASDVATPGSAPLYAALSSVAALERAGMTETGLQAARALAEQAASARDPGLEAEARLRLAALQRAASRIELAEFNDREAVGLALRSGSDGVAAAAAVALVDMIGADPTRTREAEGWVGLAEALQDRAQVSGAERAALLVAQAQLLEASGRADAAWRPLRQAAELLEDAYGDDDVRVADVRMRLGQHALRGREVEAARTAFERALSVYRASFGPLHPRTATLVRFLGEVSLLEGDLEGAAEDLDEALSVLRLYPASTLRAETMLSRATVDLARGDLDAAEETLVIVAALRDIPPEVSERARVELARLSLRRDDVDGALHEIMAGRERERAAGSPLDAVLADVMVRQGKVTEAETLLDRTISALEHEGGDASSALAEPLTVRGELLLSRSFPARALGDLERALALRSGLDAYGTARTEFALAQALVVVDPGSTRALELARDAFARVGVGEPLYTEVQRWLTNRSSAPGR